MKVRRKKGSIHFNRNNWTKVPVFIYGDITWKVEGAMQVDSVDAMYNDRDQIQL